MVFRLAVFVQMNAEERTGRIVAADGQSGIEICTLILPNRISFDIVQRMFITAGHNCMNTHKGQKIMQPKRNIQVQWCFCQSGITGCTTIQTAMSRINNDRWCRYSDIEYFFGCGSFGC